MHTFSRASASHPVNIVGHSIGCSTILALTLMDQVSPDCLNSIVLIAPTMNGFSNSYALGRNGRFYLWMQLLVGLLVLYEYIVPEWVRRNLLFHTLLPKSISTTTLSKVQGTILWEQDELSTRERCTRALEYIEGHRIPCRTFVTSISATDSNGHDYLPYHLVGPSLFLRLFGYLCDIGISTDFEQGHSLRREDVSDYRIWNGRHDGILLEATQYVFLDNVGSDVPTVCHSREHSYVKVDVDHLGPVLMLPLQTMAIKYARYNLMQQVLAFLLTCDKTSCCSNQTPEARMG